MLPLFDEVEDLIALSNFNCKELINDDEVLKDWNPLLIAIFYNHIKLVRYYTETMKVNLLTCLKMPGYKKKKQSSFASGSQNLVLEKPPFITFLLQCFKYNVKHNKGDCE